MKQDLQQTSKTMFKHFQAFLLGSSQLPAINQAIQQSKNTPLIQLWETFEPAVEADFEIIESYQEEPDDTDNQSDVRSIFRRFLKENERLAAKVEKLVEALDAQKAATTTVTNGKNGVVNSTLNAGGNIKIGDEMVVNNNGASISKQVNINDNYGSITF